MTSKVRGRMKRKIDSTAGRALYSMRVAIAEPPFANICHIMGLDRFTLRGKEKVNILNPRLQERQVFSLSLSTIMPYVLDSESRIPIKRGKG